MELTYQEFTALFTRFDREAIHLEMRDSYGTAVELPHMAKWAAGEADDLAWLLPWCDEVRANVAQGKAYRRVHVVSEPLSDYQRWSYSIMQPHIDAGTDMRWMPRRRVSSIAFPGNDFWLFDGLYRFRTCRRSCDLRFGRMSRLRQDRGLCLSACSI